MSTNPQHLANRRIAARLGVVVVAMFGFGFALVPLYDAFCSLTGLNGKTGSLEREQALTARVDRDRWVTVEFVTSVNSALPWDFTARTRKVRVHPGEITEAHFYARNHARRNIVGQAVPSVAPGSAARYFNKTECFCFTRQELKAQEGKDMPVRFVVDPNLPRTISTILVL